VGLLVAVLPLSAGVVVLDGVSDWSVLSAACAVWSVSLLEFWDVPFWSVVPESAVATEEAGSDVLLAVAARGNGAK